MMINIPIKAGIQNQEALWAPQTLFLRCGFQIFRYRGHRNKYINDNHNGKIPNKCYLASQCMFQIYKCKQFLLRSIVTDVAGLIIFKNKNVSFFVFFLHILTNIICEQILYTVSTEVIIACPMKFAAYPLDHQLCKFLVTLL